MLYNNRIKRNECNEYYNSKTIYNRVNTKIYNKTINNVRITNILYLNVFVVVYNTYHLHC